MDSIQSQIRKLAVSVNNQQRLLEQKERDSRANNMVVFGLEESSDIGQYEDTLAVINNFLENKLEITSIKAVKARRLGRRSTSTARVRPILTTFQSTYEKAAVFAKRSRLSGTKIYIKNDLTKEQVQMEKRLYNIRKELLQHPDFKEKRVSVYRNKIWVDSSPITEDMLRSAGISQ